MIDSAEVIVVGGGPAGASAACVLAAAGRDVLLLEREHGAHDKVCGEFISAEAAILLGRLGLDLQDQGGQPIRNVRLFSGARSVAESPLPFPAFGLSRRRLDEGLLAAAAAAGARLRRGEMVREIAIGGAKPTIRLAGGDQITAKRAVFLATGKHDLRGWERKRAGYSRKLLVGFKMHFRLRPGAARELREAVELHLFDGCYAGLQQVEGGVANLCLLAAPSGWEDALAHLRAASPVLTARLEGAEALWSRPLAVARIPYGFVHNPAESEAGAIWRLGDQVAVTPSFTGDGLAIALHTGCHAAAFYAAGRDAADHHAALGAVRGQVRRSMLLSRLLLNPVLHVPALGLAGLLPGLLRTGARLTRLPSAA